MRQRGAITFGPIVGIVVVVLAFIGLLALCNDSDGVDAMQQMANHEYCTADHDYCGGEDPYYGEGGYGRGYREGDDNRRGGRNGRDKRTCLMGCDNIIIVPGLPGMGGGDEPPPEEGRA